MLAKWLGTLSQPFMIQVGIYLVLTTTSLLEIKLHPSLLQKLTTTTIPKKKSSKSNNKLATVSRLSPPILAKLPKEVKDIVKFFKKNKRSKEKETLRKSYA